MASELAPRAADQPAGESPPSCAEGGLSLQFTCSGDTDREVVHAWLVYCTARATEVPTVDVQCARSAHPQRATGTWFLEIRSSVVKIWPRGDWQSVSEVIGNH